MEKLEQFLSSRLLPMSEKLQKNKVLAALMEGFIRTSPITLGIAFITIIGNFPFPGWIDFLKNVGIFPHVEAITNGATGVFSLYVVYSLAFSYAKQLGTNERNASIISLASFIMLMPQSVMTTVTQDGKAVEQAVGALRLDYLGGQGLFIGMLVALHITRFYAFLAKKNIMIKLPESVPPMVTQSLSPVFVVTIIFVVVFALRVFFGLTQSGTIFPILYRRNQCPVELFSSESVIDHHYHGIISCFMVLRYSQCCFARTFRRNQYDDGRWEHCCLPRRKSITLFSSVCYLHGDVRSWIHGIRDIFHDQKQISQNAPVR